MASFGFDASNLEGAHFICIGFVYFSEQGGQLWLKNCSGRVSGLGMTKELV